MDTPHRIEIYDRATLGGAAAAFAIIVALGTKDNPLDASLKLSIMSALIALPVLLAMYVAKPAIVTWRKIGNPSQQWRLLVAGWAALIALTALAGSVACIGSHLFNSETAGLVTFVWFELVLLLGTRADMSLARGTQGK